MASSAYELPGLRLKRQFDELTDGVRCARVKSRIGRPGQIMRVSGSGSRSVSAASVNSANGSVNSVTPSMSSVLSQLKSQRELSSTSSWSSDQNYSTATLSLEARCELSDSRFGSVGSPGSVSTVSSGSSSFSSSSLSMSTTSGLATSTTHNHPLSSLQQNSCNCNGNNTVAANTTPVPRLKLVNPQDVDLTDHYVSAELLQQRYTPVYQRPKRKEYRSPPPQPRRTSVELTIDPNTNIGTAQYLERRRRPSSCPLYDSNVVELENWPKKHRNHHQTQETPTRSNLTCRTTSSSVPNRRIRQQTFNPNFLKLYAMETTAKTNNLIPDLNVDEQVLRRLSYRDIWNLEIPASSQAHGVSVRDIKLALITRKKLWSDMMCEPRQDLHGDHAPWNMKFVVVEPPEGSQSTSEPTTRSLVRVNSDIKPWIGPCSNQMLRPSGKLKLTRSRPNQPLREVQYVVKGWCDARFRT
ncbi:LAFA_0E05314g1_1 [Lachancea sp. 'fantastica']|nr:LAFA_0E05314g1_1 [Lachancea sp. 'fantastica']